MPLKLNTGVYDSIGKYIRSRRQELSLSQRELGEMVGVTAASISHYESGRRKPNLHILKLIAAGTSTPMEAVLQFDSPRISLRSTLRAYGLTPGEVDMISKIVDYLRKMRPKLDNPQPEV